MIENGNEPDIAEGWKNRPREFGLLLEQVVEDLDRIASTTPVISAGISSLSETALDWLDRAVPAMPPRVAIGYHPYRSTPPGIPLRGYTSMEAEFNALKAICHPRPIYCTEVGWTTAPRNRDFPLCFLRTGYSDGEVAAFLREELRYNSGTGAELTCVFQLNDGPSPTEAEDRFGIRRTDGTWKPQAAVAREWQV